MGHGINDDDGQEFSKIWISDDNTKNQISAKYICCLDGILPKKFHVLKAFKFYVDGNETQTLIAREFWKLCSEKIIIAIISIKIIQENGILTNLTKIKRKIK